MATQACYIAVSENELNELIDLDVQTLLNELDALEEESNALDLGQLWDGLHFLLTGASASTPLEDNALSDAIVGIHTLHEEPFIAVIGHNELPPIIAALKRVDRASWQTAFNPQRFHDADIYPPIWLTEDRHALLSELEQALSLLINFYQRCLDEEHHAMVSIY